MRSIEDLKCAQPTAKKEKKEENGTSIFFLQYMDLEV